MGVRSLLSCLSLLLACSLTLAIPPPEAGAGAGAGAGAFYKGPASVPPMVQSFIPTAKDIASLQALKPIPAGASPYGAPAPVPRVVAPAPGAPAYGAAPPTIPPAVANLIAKYQAAAAAFYPAPLV